MINTTILLITLVTFIILLDGYYIGWFYRTTRYSLKKLFDFIFKKNMFKLPILPDGKIDALRVTQVVRAVINGTDCFFMLIDGNITWIPYSVNLSGLLTRSGIAFKENIVIEDYEKEESEPPAEPPEPPPPPPPKKFKK